MGADFADTPVNNLILRRPRSGRLEGWATHEIAEKAASQHPFCCRPFETRPCGPLLRVRFVCELAPMSGVLPAKIVIRSKRNVLWMVLSLDATRSTAIAAPAFRLHSPAA